MISLIDLLMENSTSTYDYGCVMVYFNFPELFKIQDAINPKDVYDKEGDKTYGLEDEPHCTLLYGLHEEVTTEEVKNIINRHQWGRKPLIARDISLFSKEEYDVLKFDMEGEILHKINENLKTLPFTTEYPEYHPHMTVGYLKSGTGKRYVEMLEKKLKKFVLNPQYVIFSKPDGTKDKIKINKI